MTGGSRCWFVDLDADRVEAYRLVDGHYGRPALFERGVVLAAQVLDGFTAPVSKLIVE